MEHFPKNRWRWTPYFCTLSNAFKQLHQSKMTSLWECIQNQKNQCSWWTLIISTIKLSKTLYTVNSVENVILLVLFALGGCSQNVVIRTMFVPTLNHAYSLIIRDCIYTHIYWWGKLWSSSKLVLSNEFLIVLLLTKWMDKILNKSKNRSWRFFKIQKYTQNCIKPQIRP